MNLKRFQNRRWLLIGVVCFILVGTFSYWRLNSRTPDIVTFAAVRGEFIIDIKEKGELKALNSMSISVPRNIWANVQIVAMAPEGSTVKKGDFLVQFDPSESFQRVEQKRNELQNARAELESQKASIASNMAQLENSLKTQRYSYEQAKLRYEQMKYEAETKREEQELNLKKAELALKQAEEKIESQKVIDRANIIKAELKVKQAEQQLKQAEEELKSLTLLAPIDGLVVYKEIWTPSGRAKVKVGDSPWRGMELIEIPDLSVMQVKTQVNEIDVSRIALGQQVIIKVDALPEPAFYGKVTSIATLARRERQSDVKVFDVEVTIDGSDLRLKPGMTAQCQIVTDRIPEAIYVPLESVFEKEGKTVVYPKSSGFKPQEVEVGAKNSDYIIIKKGLKEGEAVALRDPTQPLQELGQEPPAIPEKKPVKSKKERSEMLIIG